MSHATEQSSNAKGNTRWLIVGVVAILAIGLVWGLVPVDHTAHGISQRQLNLDVDFDKFRQIMVRKNATQAIVNHSGMKLIDESISELNVEVPQQDRPILNAILGKAKGELTATKEITVSLSDPSLNAKELRLTQHSEVQSDSLVVRSESSQPAGNLKSYLSGLTATAFDGGTKVDLSIEQTVAVRIPRMFVTTADRRVQQAADASTQDQEEAIRQLINENKGALIVLPELKK